ncbi:alpha/beta hydrolase [Leptobacterium sp. I13]|uniref:alpha/beta hydrolase n=1 Tax=Leptobacterium meishanense TaxID=3128904 RepID=UPI0030EC453D
MKILYTAFLSLYTFIGFSQVKQTPFNSYKLNEERPIQVYVPENYNEEKSYPLIVVLDAEYLFDIVVSNTKFYSYWDEMPQAIVVGINQNYDNIRVKDCEYSDENGFPSGKGNDFFEFIGMELIPYLDEQYKLANFKVIVGHSLTSNFINYYLFKEKPLFDSYINLSPSLAPLMEEHIPERIATFQDKKFFYYLATAQEDLKENSERIYSLHQQMKTVDKPNIQYYFDDFKGATHISLASYAVPKALDQIFGIYKPISVTEYKEKILMLETPIYDYLEEKYNTIKTLFGIEKQVSLNDIMAIYAAIKQKEDMPSLERLAKLGKQQYPSTMLGYYFEAEYYEQVGEPKKAMRTYEKAFGMEEIDFLTKDMALDKIDAIKADFGW